MSIRPLHHILAKATEGLPLSKEDVLQLLSVEDPESFEQVTATARKIRSRHFENHLFVYGFIYLSTYCRNHCAFCFYRKTNKKSPRYRKGPGEVGDIACELARSGVHLVDLTLGEDPLMHDTGDFQMLFDTVVTVKRATGLPVMVSPGVVPEHAIHELGALDTDWYALYQETHNHHLFDETRIGQHFEKRNEARRLARAGGMLIEDGMLLGIGETLRDRANAILTMKQSGVNQARIMGLVPQPGTPFENKTRPSRIAECLCIATMRLVMPDRLIPASLDIEGIRGLKIRLDAGANVITSIIPPDNRLAGVSQSTLDIEQGLRTVPQVRKIAHKMGLEIAPRKAYTSWVAQEKRRTEKEGTVTRAELN